MSGVYTGRKVAYLSHKCEQKTKILNRNIDGEDVKYGRDYLRSKCEADGTRRKIAVERDKEDRGIRGKSEKWPSMETKVSQRTKYACRISDVKVIFR